MVTFTERYGELWEMFITKKFKNRTMTLTHKRLVLLANEFEGFLNRLAEGLGVAG